mmetsp:Transcript_43363/g.105088  ORF Transcript_43363/g.105088 Transcript_43363/m.105088 type:complete len:254 (-) Transcript_43363:882-1643(-)
MVAIARSKQLERQTPIIPKGVGDLNSPEQSIDSTKRKTIHHTRRLEGHSPRKRRSIPKTPIVREVNPIDVKREFLRLLHSKTIASTKRKSATLTTKSVTTTTTSERMTVTVTLIGATATTTTATTPSSTTTTTATRRRRRRRTRRDVNGGQEFVPMKADKEETTARMTKQKAAAMMKAMTTTTTTTTTTDAIIMLTATTSKRRWNMNIVVAPLFGKWTLEMLVRSEVLATQQKSPVIWRTHVAQERMMPHRRH